MPAGYRPGGWYSFYYIHKFYALRYFQLGHYFTFRYVYILHKQITHKTEKTFLFAPSFERNRLGKKVLTSNWDYANEPTIKEKNYVISAIKYGVHRKLKKYFR